MDNASTINQLIQHFQWRFAATSIDYVLNGEMPNKDVNELIRVLHRVEELLEQSRRVGE